MGLYTFKHTTMTDGLAGEELTVQFYVPGNMTDATVSLAFTECLYDGTAACPTVVVTQGGKTLVEGLDYTVTYRGYNGDAKMDTDLNAKFHIAGQDLVNATITLESEHILYDGTPREPKVTVVYDGKTLVEGTDYSLSYAHNVASGVATITCAYGRSSSMNGRAQDATA